VPEATRFSSGYARSLAIVALVLACRVEARAQETEAETREEELLRKRREKARSLSPYGVSKTEARVKAFEETRLPARILQKGFRGFRPVIGGMPSGSGTVLGGGYIRGLENEYVQFQVNGRWSTKGYTMADGEFVIPPPQIGRRIEFKLRGEYRDLTSLRFYGLGNDSSVENESTYLLNDRGVTAYFWLNPRGLLSLGALGGYVSTLTDSGDANRSIEEVFDPAAVPGFQDPRTQYAYTGGWVEFDIRDKWEEPPVGIVARVTSARYEDTGISEHDFTRVVGDVKAYVPLGARNRVLAFRLRTSHSLADDGKEVPFYLMETLGGAKDVRGYREYRFRDTRNLLASAEYRWEVWNFVDFSFFFDAGKVFRNASDFNFDRMHTGYGFGVRAHAPPNFTLRFDLAKSTEGFRFHISGGPSF
jgi:outer membrane protein assembly factor BamA